MLNARTKTGIRRSAIAAIILTIVFSVLYQVLDDFVVSRRQDLVPLEVIGYVFVANMFTLLICYILFRMFRWVVDGFKVAPNKE
jgi:hypothetical protein